MPGAQTMSMGPSPVTWYAIRTFPLRAYFVSGRFNYDPGGRWFEVLRWRRVMVSILPNSNLTT